ncbi:hypothetical protein ABIF38_001541 [Bradyrhizobium japonicum]|uniref:Uncharacterized protein n=1 Tax=Bradyrhizobium elkanii TaxID=29448 RepID=A0ABV4FHR2_BRAEL|nr:hypothetical protein [Bradyrhizobium elkanii]MBP2430517.1 hypothetical protein [Bradyrhizobium elkanii]MCP1736143.1 hypothetical protein [Bradyrhizobium elkanii]MCP1753940.1 hypothetical protein [Bradyrhizobium elkanii]MCP1979460.1 hypothetical protein [Bradyrhizobium elkanii]MCS3571484.1 hypothetical protein [Bradyrhizobium elkanii]
MSFSAIKPADSPMRDDINRNLQELIMMRWIGVAAVACAFALTAPASATAAASAKPQAAAPQRQAEGN